MLSFTADKDSDFNNGLNLMRRWLQMGLKWVPIWIKPSALITSIAEFYKNAGWFFPFHKLKAENMTFCFYFSCFSAVQFLCLSQAFLSTVQMGSMIQLLHTVPHTIPPGLQQPVQKSSTCLVWYLLVPCGCLRHPGHIKWDCIGLFRNTIAPKQWKDIALFSCLSQSTLRQVVHARN